jgi:diaminopimelate epimerase
MIFYKTSSFGNDFIEIDLRDLPAGAQDRAGRKAAIPFGGKGALAGAICDRQRGVGADGVVFYRVENKKFHFEIFNRDGGGAELSGNGMAGLAAVLFQRRLAPSPLLLHAASGRRRIDLLARRGPVFQLNVEIGQPDFSNRKFFPFLKDRQDSYVTDGLEFYPVSVGNPHAVVICRDALSSEQLEILGRKLESHPMFPRRVNVEFVHFAGAENHPAGIPPEGSAATRPASCRVFFYERGVGPTLSSSTGSAAVFAVLRRLGMVGDRLDIECGAEKIAVSWQRGIFINNFTRLVCRGDYFC